MDRQNKRAGAATTAAGSRVARSAELTRIDNAMNSKPQTRMRFPAFNAVRNNAAGKQAADMERRGA